MHQPIRTLVIPVAGYGTRFLPFTKAMPKEMLPIIDKPVIQYVVEEAVAAGITDIVLVTSYAKRPVEDHFDRNTDLEEWLKKQGKLEQLDEIQRISSMANFVYVRQKGPYGNATPVANVRHVVGDKPFAVMWGDEVFVSDRPRLRQLMDVYEEHGNPVLSVMQTDDEGTKKYGIADPASKPVKGVFKVKQVIEKPGPEAAPSTYAVLGSYILTPDIFDEIGLLQAGHGGEFVLLDAIHGLMKRRSVYACEVKGEFFDAGSKVGWLKANIAMALQRPDLAKEVKAMLKSL